MAAEIERKFLIPALPDAAARPVAVRIEQGYVAIGERTEVRLRRAAGRMTLTAKRGRGEVRSEHEIALYKEQFERLWALTGERQLVKTRRRVPLGGGLVAEVDVFEGALAGLATVEVEFSSAAASRAFQPPEWFGTEVTGDHAYSNQSLAANGSPRRTSGAEGKYRGVSRAYRLKRKEKVDDGLRRIAAGRAEKAAERLRGTERDELAAAIHGARKDLKKLRSVLRLLRGELGKKRFRAEDRRYRDAARLLSASRDAEVKLATLRKLEDWAGDKFPAGASLAWYEVLEADRRRIAGDTEGDVAARVEEAITAIEEAAERIPGWRLGGGAWRMIEPGLGRAYRDGRTGLARVRADGSAENVHEFRKRGKDLWYQLRLLHDGWPGLLGPSADEAHELTDLLGDHHDLAVLAEDLAPRTGLVASPAKLEELIAARQEELLDAALELGERLYAEKPKHYLRRLRAYWRAWRG